MIRVLLIGHEESHLSSLSQKLWQYNNVSVMKFDSGRIGLDLIHYNKVDFVIADEQLEDMTGLKFVERLVDVNPMMNCALISSLSVEDFHEATEGLGIIAQLPTQPDENQIEEMIHRLNKILDMTG